MSLQYTIPARLYPFLLVCLPASLAVAAWFPDKFVGYGFLSTIATASGFVVLMTQLGRDAGVTKEQALWDSWGGKPTTQLLRHRDRQINPNTKARYHAKLAAIVPDVQMPTPEDEARDPQAADHAYDSCANYLIQKTRNHKQFPLLFHENVSYGFRRNLWGMKRAGTAFSVIGLVTSVLPVAIYWNQELRIVAVVATAINAFMLAWWLLRFNPDWIRIPAFAYAEELYAASDNL